MQTVTGSSSALSQQTTSRQNVLGGGCNYKTHEAQFCALQKRQSLYRSLVLTGVIGATRSMLNGKCQRVEVNVKT